MNLLIAFILIVIGFVFLVKGADWFVDNASGIATKIGVSPLVIGLTIVAFGTSMPELAVSVTAALEGANEIAVGNVVGSNIFNLLVVAGLSACIYPLVVNPTIFKRDWPISTLAAIVLMIFLIDSTLSSLEGIILLIFFAIILFSQFNSFLISIKKRLEVENLTYCYLDGSLSQKKRDEEVFKFNNSDSSIFLISLKAGGVGLNLQSADIVIHFDPWWNPAIEAQASDRAHRIGQKKIVEVIKLIAKDTIEEKVIKLQNEKKELINNILDDKSLKNNHIFDLSEDEILNLFK